MAGDKKYGEDAQDRPGKRKSRVNRSPDDPPGSTSGPHTSQPSRQHVVGSGQSVHQQLRHMSHLAREASIAAADAQAAAELAQSEAVKAHNAAYRSKSLAQSIESAVHSLEHTLTVESSQNPDGMPSISAKEGAPPVLNTKVVKMESPSESDSYDPDEDEDEHRPSKKPRTAEARLFAAPSPDFATPTAPHPPAHTTLCWYCKVGRHPPQKCLRVEPDTGMTRVCPIHPYMKTHSLDECNSLWRYLSMPHLRIVLYSLMGPERKGLPPIYTRTVCINELATSLYMPLADLPWSVEHSVLRWRLHSQLFNRSLNYEHTPPVPGYTAEMHRNMTTGPQTLHSRRPLYGDLRSLVTHLGRIVHPLPDR